MYIQQFYCIHTRGKKSMEEFYVVMFPTGYMVVTTKNKLHLALMNVTRYITLPIVELTVTKYVELLTSYYKKDNRQMASELIERIK